MAITLDGTTGITTPGLTNTGSTTIVALTTTGNTILGDASTDTLNVGNGNLVTDASGNVGVGVTPSAWVGYKVLQAGIGSFIGGSSGAYLLQDNAYTDNSGAGWKYINSSYAAAQYYAASGAHVWRTAPSGTAGNAITFTQAMTLDASGNLGIGTTSPSGILHVNGVQDGTAGKNVRFSYSGTYYLEVNEQSIRSFSNPLIFGSGTSGVERARITSGGYFKASNSSGTYIGINSSYHELVNNVADWTLYSRNSNASPYGVMINHTTDANATGNSFLYCSATNSETIRMSVRSNGGIANYSANNVNLSDRREKINFAPATSYLDKICAIPVQTFNYIDQNMEDDGGLTLGVVAQDVQAVAPELVMESNWAAKDETPKMRLSIYQTDLQYALMKCIQEQQALITTLTDRITALEAK